MIVPQKTHTGAADWFARKCAVALRRANITHEHFRVIRRWHWELDERLDSLIAELTNPDRYLAQETKAKAEYAHNYKIVSLEQQIDALTAAWPCLRPNTVRLAARNMPVEADGLFAIPKWMVLAESYSEAVEIAFVALARSLNGRISRELKLGEWRFDVHPSAAKNLTRIAETCRGDFIIIPAQLGRRHQGRSINRAREMLSEGEFGLDLFSCLCMFITHCKSIWTNSPLGIACAGTRCVSRWKSVVAPVFDNYNGLVRLSCQNDSHESACTGIPSAFG